jgi:hypothetical protein
VYNTFFSAILHTGDLSGQAVPLRLALKWGDRVIEEFKEQARKETLRGLTVAPFMINLESPSRAANVQKGYIDFILKPWWLQFLRFFPDNADLQSGLASIEEVRAFYSAAADPNEKTKQELKVRMEAITVTEEADDDDATDASGSIPRVGVDLLKKREDDVKAT